MHSRGLLMRGLEVIPSSPTIEVWEGRVGPPNSGKPEKVAAVKRLAYLQQWQLPRLPVGNGVWVESPGHLQSSEASPMRLVREDEEGSCGPSPHCVKGQSTPQCPSLLYLGQGLGGGRELGHTDPVSFLFTLETRSRRCLEVPFVGSCTLGFALQGLCQKLKFGFISFLFIFCCSFL